MSALTLGLDVGPNSIGWALVDEENQRIVDLGSRVFPEGVDNFDTSKERSRNEDRRIARGMRRQIARRSRRERKLREVLVAAGLFPSDPDEQETLCRLDPYEIRAKALDEKQPPHEIGRAFLHLNQRRGFLSNRKKDRGDKEVKGMLEEISELAKGIKESGSRTLGEYLFKKCESFDHARRRENDHVRNRHTRRDMLEAEFDKIWDAQAKHYPELLTETLRYGEMGKRDYPRKPGRKPEGMSHLQSFGIHGIIFFQRKMYWPKSVVGLCELEPKEKRCPRADRSAQRFRLLQEVNNLRYIDPNAREESKLNDEQRALLLDHLATREKATFDDIRKKLGFLESVKFNLERGKRSSLKGMIVDWQMAKAVGKDWHKRAEEEKDAIVRMLLNNEREEAIIEHRLVDELGFTAEQADAALGVDFPAGYVGLSLKAINKLLPPMERGLVYQSLSDSEQSAVHAAGYLRRDELQRRLFDRLPDPARMNPRDCPIGDIPNPVVKRTLVELRKVVNAIIREYGKPDAVHVEMGRDVKTRPKNKNSLAYKKYKEQEAARVEQERKRTAAKEKLRENGVSYGAGGRNILKYLLWEEQERLCTYSGRPISFTQLMSEEIEIDHILPKSQSLDDSYMNKVVCFHTENHPNGGKGQQTPREWLEDSNLAKYEAVCQRAKALPYPKYARFLRKTAKNDDFIDRQLNDTRYIAKATVEFLHLVIEKKHDVIGLKGQLTSTLRRLWGLDTILSQLPDSPAWNEQSKIRPGKKNRADHRHHAIDALVIALTNRPRLQQLSRGFAVEEYINPEVGASKFKSIYRGERISAPWEGFRDDAVDHIRQLDAGDHGYKFRRGISYRVDRKVAGALHKDSFYGPTPETGVFVKRKSLTELSTSEVEAIRDKTLRNLVIKKLQDAGLEFGRGKKTDESRRKQVLSNLTMKSGVPIKKVRLLVSEKTIQPIRKDKSDEALVLPGATHHLCIFEWEANGKPKRDADFITQLEAINRVKRQQQELSRLMKKWNAEGHGARELVSRKRQAMREIAERHPLVQREASQLEGEARLRIPPHAKFVFSLSKNEALLLEIDGVDKLYIYDTAASTTHQMTFYPHTAAKRDGKSSGKLTKYPGSLFALNPRKVTVDPLGRIRWAND